MTVHNRRLKIIEFVVDGNSFDCQLADWTLDPGVQDGDRKYTYCSTGDNSFIEETDNEPTLELHFFADWRSAGISRFLWANQNTTVAFTLDHHPDIAAEHITFSGNVFIKPAAVGGEARSTEMTEITLQIVGDVTYTPEVP